MRIQIFDVEHGACALVTSSSGARMLIDCGHNATTGWRPSTYLPANGISEIEMFVITNYDEDHVSDLPNTLARVNFGNLLRNTTVDARALTYIKHEHGMDRGIEAVRDMLPHFTLPMWPVDWGDVSWNAFYNNYPVDFDDENNLSVALFIQGAGFKILFPGDMQREGWLRLLEREAFRNELRSVNILVAPHHGREDGCCAELFGLGPLRPDIVVMSDKPIMHATQETVNWYGARAKGVPWDTGKTRYVLTTRTDGRVAIETYQGSGFWITTS